MFDNVLEKLVRITIGLAFIVAGIISAIELFSLGLPFLAAISGFGGVAMGLMFWFPRSAKQICEEVFDSI